MILEITVRLEPGEEWATWQRNGAGVWEDSDGERAEPGMARGLDALEKAIAADPYTPKEFGGVVAQRVRA